MQEEIERNALNGQYETKEDKTPILTIKSRRKVCLSEIYQ